MYTSKMQVENAKVLDRVSDKGLDPRNMFELNYTSRVQLGAPMGGTIVVRTTLRNSAECIRILDKFISPNSTVRNTYNPVGVSMIALV